MGSYCILYEVFVDLHNLQMGGFKILDFFDLEDTFFCSA